MALADLDTLEVEADVAEANVAKLGPNQPAEATVEAFPDRKYKSVLRQIIPTADRGEGTTWAGGQRGGFDDNQPWHSSYIDTFPAHGSDRGHLHGPLPLEGSRHPPDAIGSWAH